MSETVKVISASNPNPWEHGITYYDMVFDRGGQQFSCSWGTKGGEPQPGEEVTGEFSQKTDGSWKFTKGSKDKPQGGGSTGTSGGQNQAREWKPESERDPERAARILRQHSQEMALRAATAAGYFKGEIAPEKLQDDLRPLIDWFDQDVNEAGQRAIGGVGVSNPGRDSGSGLPSPATAPTPQSPPAGQGEEIQWLTKRLEDAAVFPHPAHELATFAFQKLPEERRKKLESALSDHETQQGAVKGLRAVYEEIEGKPVPDKNPDDEIVF